MAAHMGLAQLIASPDELFRRSTSPELVKKKELDQRLFQKLETTLYAVTAVINDAEQKQIKDPAVKKWFDALKDAVYDADDLLDELSTKAATEKQVSNFLGHPTFHDREMGNKIEEIIQRLEGIKKQNDIWGLKNIVGDTLPQRPQSSSLVLESDVYGREKDKEEIIDILLSDGTSDGKIGVIPIVGMGGIGKTTLAQLVYNDNNVQQNFNLRAWVCVSNDFDVSRIIKNIMEDISGVAYNKEGSNSLQIDLKERLKEKKFLVVLDDVWNENYTDWNPLMTLFHHGSEGSKIIVTTRSAKVASVVQTISIHRLGHLSDEDCWLVFVKHASPSKPSISNLLLEEVRGDIIRKCRGLPLAAKILGGLLRSKPDVKNWEIVLKSGMWNSFELENKVIPALKVSYHYLPSHLKKCFVHCSLFPKGFEFTKKELTLLWMAADLLKPNDRNMTLEEIGYEYFEELTSRLFFQCSNNSKGQYVMHDLIHDLAKYFAGEFYCRLEIGVGNNISNKTRHLSYIMLSGSEISTLEAVSSAKALRTFLPIGHPYSKASSEDVPRTLKLLSNCRCLRVLSLKFIPIEVLPNSIGEMIHLRYLNLSTTKIKFLPNSLCKLHNLQILKLRFCHNLTRLPIGIQDLVNLRYLDVHESGLEEMPSGMGKLKNLHFLSDFVIGKDKGSKIEELGGLSNLANELVIQNLQNVRNKEEVSQARIMDKKYIDKLRLYWETHDVDDLKTEKDILEMLKPHKNLRSIWIEGYMGKKFSDWLGHHSYHNITEMTLENCKNCSSLPTLGQLPLLMSLNVAGFEMLETIGDGFYKSNYSSLSIAFPSLESLEFHNMSAWEDWCLFEKDAFPLLGRLKLYNCPKMVGDLPKHLPALKNLRILMCQQLASPIPWAPLIDTLAIYRSTVVLQAEEGPLSVKNLEIRECERLEFPNQLCCESLESLRIINSCSSLTSLLIDTFPNLKHLCIKACENLKIVSVSQASLQNLREVTIYKCRNLEDVKIEGFVPPNMTPWMVFDCPKLKPLPDQMIVSAEPLSNQKIVPPKGIYSIPSTSQSGPIFRRKLQIQMSNF